jgi:tRNA A-37 threonylcarbamoyl transferase component Bud32
MGSSFYKKVSVGEIKGWITEELIHLLPPVFFEDPFSFIGKMGGEVIKASRIRSAAITTLSNGQRVFLKRDRTKDWIESIKYLLLPSKGRKEWFIAYQMHKRNLPIPKPLGWLERAHRGFVQESYYLSEAIGSGVSLIEDSAKLGNRFPLIELAKAVRKIHNAGLFHKDLHAGNFLWDGESLFLTDLHSAKILGTLSLNQRLWNLSLLFHSLRSVWVEREQSLFMDTYFEGELHYLRKKEELLQRIHVQMGRLQKRQWRSRTKRCLKESTEFSIQRVKGFRYYHRRDFDLDKVKRIVGEHLRLLKGSPSSLAKNAPEVSVSIMKDEGVRVCVKHFRNLNLWRTFKDHFRQPKGLKSWVGSHGLRVRDIPSLTPLALVEKRRWSGLRESFFLMEASETGQEMDRYILERLGDLQKKRLFTKAFAQWLSHLHQKGVYHQDMKTCNILILENGETWTFHLLDLEDVLLDEKVRERKLLKNFLQLNTSTPRTVTKTDRFRFLKEYLRGNPILNRPDVFIQELMKESRRRGIVYVSSQGVVEESF